MSSRRFYRQDISTSRFSSFAVIVKETDLWIAVSSASFEPNLPLRIEKLILKQRSLLETYLAAHPHFAASLKPCPFAVGAPAIAQSMVRAANRAGVGPMAAVAGAFAEVVGLDLLNCSTEAIVENGGDIFVKVDKPLSIGIYAGKSSLSGRLALQIEPEKTPLGICTSSGTVGPSLSFGHADAVVVLSQSVPLADAVATAAGNYVRGPADLEKALKYTRSIDGITGALIICRDKMAAWGDIELKGT